MPPLPADSIHARACKLKCEKILTRPPSVLLPEKADGKKHSQSAFQIFEEGSLVAFFKKKTDVFLFNEKHIGSFNKFFLYCCSGFILANSGSLAAMHRGTGTFSPSLQTLRQSSLLGFL